MHSLCHGAAGLWERQREEYRGAWKYSKGGRGEGRLWRQLFILDLLYSPA